MPDADDGYINEAEITAGVQASITLDPDAVLVPGDQIRVTVIGAGGSESITSYTLTEDDINAGSVTLILDLDGIPEGQVEAAAVVVSDAGESSSNTVTFELDVSPPDAPVLEESAGVIIGGQAEANSTVLIDTDNNGSYDYETTADSNGEWSIVLDAPLADGATVTAVAEDPAGNVSDSNSVVIAGEVAAPTNLQVVTPLLGLLLGSDITGTAVGANQIRIDVFQDDLLSSVDGGTILVDVDEDGNFSIPLTVLGNLLDSVLGLLVGNEGVNLGFTAVEADGTVSSTEIVFVGEGTSVIADPTGALVDLIDTLVGGLLGSTEDLVIEGSVYIGNELGNYFTGTEEAELMAGGAGNDVLIGGGGADIISGGTGDDFISVPDTSFTAIDGGEGFDVLAWEGGDISLNLENLSDRIANIEAIDLNNTSAVDLQISLEDLINVTDAETERLYITGDGDDSVTLVGDWQTAGTGNADGVEYTIYTQVGDTNELWVQSGISVV